MKNKNTNVPEKIDFYEGRTRNAPPTNPGPSFWAAYKTVIWISVASVFLVLTVVVAVVLAVIL